MSVLRDAKREAMLQGMTTSFSAFMCHPLLYRQGEDAVYTAPDGLPYSKVHTVQHAHVQGQQPYPNKATHWVRHHFKHVCAANLAVYADGELHVIDVLARNEGVDPLERDPSGYTAVFLLQTGGSRAKYARALQHARRIKRILHEQYNFRVGMLLVHLTRKGMLRRRAL